ncbi:MAG: hypothetical protein ACTSQI_22540 [Candidatus Helarchaeota archaeon]
MANVKLNNKKLLEKLQAQLTLIQGKKMSQQELLDKCIEFSEEHFDDFINEKLSLSLLTPEKMERILSNPIDVPIYFKNKSDDELIYDI